MAVNDKAKILVVDDLAENLLSYQAILEELGQDLVLVSSGEDALKEVLRSDFAVILLDVNMPGVDGLETAALIRNRKRSAHTPIIFITAFTDELRVSEAYAHGAVDYISSPVVPAVLRAKVRVFVDLFRMTAQIRRHAEEQVALAEERSKREAAEDSNRRLSFLARAGAVITKSLDRETTIDSIMRLVVPEHADQALLAEFDNDGQFRAVWARRFEETAPLKGERGLAELPDAWRHALHRAFVSGNTDSSDAAADSNGSPPSHIMAMPLRDRDRAFAVLLLARGSLYGTYSQADVAMFESFAWRAAIALVNARLYQEIEQADQQKNR